MIENDRVYTLDFWVNNKVVMSEENPGELVATPINGSDLQSVEETIKTWHLFEKKSENENTDSSNFFKSNNRQLREALEARYCNVMSDDTMITMPRLSAFMYKWEEDKLTALVKKCIGNPCGSALLRAIKDESCFLGSSYERNWSCLIASGGDVEMVKVLNEAYKFTFKGKAVPGRPGNYNPMHEAFSKGQYEVVKTLLDLGVSFYIADSFEFEKFELIPFFKKMDVTDVVSLAQFLSDRSQSGENQEFFNNQFRYFLNFFMQYRSDVFAKLHSEGLIPDQFFAECIAFPLYRDDESKLQEALEVVNAYKGEQWTHPMVFLAAQASDNQEWIKKTIDAVDFSKVDDEMSKQIWQWLSFSDNLELARALLERGLPVTKAALEMSIKNQKVDFTLFIAQEAEKRSLITPEEVKDLFDLALKRGNIGMVKALKAAFPQCHESDLIADLFGGEMSTHEKIKTRLEILALMSPLADFKEVLSTVKNNGVEEAVKAAEEVEQEYWTWAPYIAHYTSDMSRASISKNYKQGKDLGPYVEGQIRYGQRQHKLMKQYKKEWKKAPLRELIELWVDELYKGKQPCYKPNTVFQSDVISDSTAIDYPSNAGYFPWNNALKSRYTEHNLKYILHSVRKNNDEKNNSYKLSYKDHGEGVSLLDAVLLSPKWSSGYDFDRLMDLSKKDEKELTSIRRSSGKWHWKHTNPDITRVLWPTMEAIHKKLRDMEVDTKSLESIKNYEDLLAEGYWLGCNLMPTTRGNAQNFQNWLAEMCLTKGFYPPIPSKQCPQVDTVAISVSLDEFKENFRSYFDSCLVPK